MAELKKKILEPNHECSPASNPTECLTQLMGSKEMADLTIIIPGHDEHFKVHRLILGMWSRVFQVMLFGPMAEGDTITLEEDYPKGFRWLLNYMYTGETTLPSVELALQVYLLSNKYLMVHLKTVCSKYLIDTVSAVTVPEVLNAASLLEDEGLINKCAKVLESSPDSFFSSPTIGSLNGDSLEQLLRKDLPVSSESVIFQGVLNWGRAHLTSKDKEITTITVRQEVDKFLPQVRFLSMSLEEVVKHVLPEHILTWEELEAIQLNIAGVTEVSLPTLFSTNKEKRNRFHESQLDICRLCKGHRFRSGDYDYFSNPDILAQIKSSNIIYLHKLEYESNIGYKGTLIVKDSTGLELQTAKFDGRVADLDEPLKMLPEKRYTFTLNCGRDQTLDTSSYVIKDNGFISGYMLNDFTKPCVLHYWK